MEAKAVRPLFRQPEAEKPEAKMLVDDSGCLIWTPKKEEFLEAFKALVPWIDRSWHVEIMAWFAAEKYAENLAGLLTLFYDPVEVIDDRGSGGQTVRRKVAEAEQAAEDRRKEEELAEWFYPYDSL